MMRKLLIVLVLMVAAGGTALIAATFGRETIGGAASINIEGEIACGKFAPASDGTATNITWYTTQSGTHNSKAAIYVYTSDSDAGAKIAESTEDPGAADAAWRTGTITASLVSGTNYYLCAWAPVEAGSAFLNHTATGGISVKDTATYGTWPDPLVEASNNVFHHSIYVTYTETTTGNTVILGGGICAGGNSICGN